MPDGAALLDRYGIGASERELRQAFLNITATDATNLRELRGTFADFARTFAERFYEHLLANTQTAGFLKNPQQLEQLKKLQAGYFAELLEGVFDAAYFEGRLRVGLAHERIGLDPSWYLGAYNQYIQLTFPVFARAFGNDLEKVLPLILSLVKVVFLDIGLALHTYFQKAIEELRRHNQELEQALGLYWETQRREEQLRKLISHEVRGGLAAIITALEDLTDSTKGQLDAGSARELNNVTRRCWSLSHLLADMLVRAHEGQTAAWVETAPIFENMVSRLALYAEGRKIQLRLPDHAPRVWADALHLQEVFANLVSNAARYLDKEPGEIEISCQPEGAFYIFCVADNGPGIRADLKDKIFEPFFRGPESHQHPAGTGLGLYFVRAMVEQGGGRVWLEANDARGHGSRFLFTVPRVAGGSRPMTSSHSGSDKGLGT